LIKPENPMYRKFDLLSKLKKTCQSARLFIPNNQRGLQ
jgi:hypothetical protein